VRDRNDRDCRDPDQHDDQNLEESSRFDQFEMLFQFAIFLPHFHRPAPPPLSVFSAWYGWVHQEALARQDEKSAKLGLQLSPTQVMSVIIQSFEGQKYE
jgi:hypothetical protein